MALKGIFYVGKIINKSTNWEISWLKDFMN
nr:MAG TPA: hypothetical protein [Caudoviricetes sp.]